VLLGMPGRYSTRRRGNYPRSIVTSIKNVPVGQLGTTGALTNQPIAKAVTAPSPTVKTDVAHGCIIKAVWIVIDMCGLGGTGVLNVIDAYLFKNPGDNLTSPLPDSVGSSNEKKFVFKQWRAMMMRNQDGNPPYHWEGWVKIPKRYQRMGTDDTLKLVFACTSGLTGHASWQAIYKWYR